MIAIFADIHANRPAFEACLRQATEQGAADIVLLGDYVGYGADPEWTVNKVIDLVSAGAIAVRGNHDTAVADARVSLNIEAQVAMEWTRGELGRRQRELLGALPLSVNSGDVLYVHADTTAPGNWNYVVEAAQAARSLLASPARVIFCGHTHVPAVYSMAPTGKVTAFTPVDGVPIELLRHRRWLVVAGSVGQPRDGRAAASYILFDPDRMKVTFCRAPYDVDQAASRIREKRLPSWLADRLYLGR